MPRKNGKRARKKSAQPGDSPLLNYVIHDNIRAILAHREQAARRKTMRERLADAITDFSGSMYFVALHVVWFVLWVLLNSGWFGWKPFDPFPYGLLTMIVSLEAIFLSAFVLISQNRMSQEDQEREEMDLQIDLLTEHELTRVLQMLDQIQDRLGIENHRDQELIVLERETKPEEVLEEIEQEMQRKKKKSSV